MVRGKKSAPERFGRCGVCGWSATLILLGLCLCVMGGGRSLAQCSCGYGDGLFTINQPITADGLFGDWSAVLADSDNNSCDGGDGIPPLDRDAPVQSTGRDLLHFAVTWDSTHLQTYTARQASTNNKLTFVYYADTNNNGLMETGERVIAAVWQGNNRQVNLYYGSYSSSAAGGDPMVDGSGFADGYTLPGALVGLPRQPNQSGAWGGSDGLAMEWEVPWSVLGIPPGSAFTFHVSSSNAAPGASNFANKIDDNMGGCGGGAASTQYAVFAFTPDVTVYGHRNTTVYTAHVLVNQGNGADTFNFASTVAGDHTPAVSYYHDADASGTFTAGDTLLTDTDGDGKPDTGPVNAGDGFYLLVAYTIAGDGTGTATAAIAATSAFDPNRSTTVTDTIGLAPILTVVKTAAPASVAAGANVTYTITITNSGYGDALLTRVQDTLSAGFTYVPGSSTGLTTADPSIAGDSVLNWDGNWKIPKKAGGTDGTLTLSFQTAAASTSGTYPNHVTVSGGNFNAVSTGPTAEVTVTAPLVSLTKSVDKSQAQPGEVLTYTIHYRNTGDGPAHTLMINDTIPSYTTYVAGSLRAGDADSSYSTATAKTDVAGDDEGTVNSATVMFTIDHVAANDDNDGTGPDEGKVYFQLKVK